jgi:hypothetical protein
VRRAAGRPDRAHRRRHDLQQHRRQVFDALWTAKGRTPTHHRGQGPEADDRQRRIEAIIDEVLAANPKSVEEFRAGKDKAFNALVGQAMKASKGKANPQQVNEIFGGLLLLLLLLRQFGIARACCSAVSGASTVFETKPRLSRSS